MISLTFSLSGDLLDPHPPTAAPTYFPPQVTEPHGHSCQRSFQEKSKDGASGIAGSRCSLNTVRFMLLFRCVSFQADTCFSRGPLGLSSLRLPSSVLPKEGPFLAVSADAPGPALVGPAWVTCPLLTTHWISDWPGLVMWPPQEQRDRAATRAHSIRTPHSAEKAEPRAVSHSPCFSMSTRPGTCCSVPFLCPKGLLLAEPFPGLSSGHIQSCSWESCLPSTNPSP